MSSDVGVSESGPGSLQKASESYVSFFNGSSWRCCFRRYICLHICSWSHTHNSSHRPHPLASAAQITAVINVFVINMRSIKNQINKTFSVPLPAAGSDNILDLGFLSVICRSGFFQSTGPACMTLFNQHIPRLLKHHTF